MRFGQGCCVICIDESDLFQLGLSTTVAGGMFNAGKNLLRLHQHWREAREIEEQDEDPLAALDVAALEKQADDAEKAELRARLKRAEDAHNALSGTLNSRLNELIRAGEIREGGEFSDPAPAPSSTQAQPTQVEADIAQLKQYAAVQAAQTTAQKMLKDLPVVQEHLGPEMAAALQSRQEEIQAAIASGDPQEATRVTERVLTQSILEAVKEKQKSGRTTERAQAQASRQRKIDSRPAGVRTGEAPHGEEPEAIDFQNLTPDQLRDPRMKKLIHQHMRRQGYPGF